MNHEPKMDWSVQNQADTFKLFKQRIELHFKAKRIEPEDQVVHILLQVGDEGLRRYNSWSLTEDEIVWQRRGLTLHESTHKFREIYLKIKQFFV